MDLKKLEEILEVYHKKNRKAFIENRVQIDGYIDDSFKEVCELFVQKPHADYVYIQESLAWYHLDQAIYDAYHKINKEEILKSLAYSSVLSYLTIVPSSQFCGCMEYNPKLEMGRAGILLALQVMIGEQKEIHTSTQALVNSLNAKGCLIGRGSAKDVQAWFTLELVSNFHGIEILKKRTRYPKKNYSYYEDVLAHWDTEDMLQIEKSISTLCEVHLSIVMVGQTDPNEMVEYVIPGYEEPKTNFLTLPFIQLVPYDVLAWLKLRERSGLKNPKTFSHPLMNTPIAKIFLNIKEPLPKPTELPYAKELLEKLKEQCPDVEVPEWLDENNEDILPDDFMK